MNAIRRFFAWLDEDVTTIRAFVLIAWLAIFNAMIDTIVLILRAMF
jgi:hypothetical protein